MKNILALIVLALLFSHCQSNKEVAAFTSLTPQEYSQLTESIIRYMECDDCEEGELDSLINWKSGAVPTLIVILKEGASPSRKEEYLQHLSSTYKSNSEYSKSHPAEKIKMTEKEYISMHIDNYNAQYKSRAARALGILGGESSKKALMAAQEDKSNRKDVQLSIQDALKRIK